jgi:hypothetical protein
MSWPAPVQAGEASTANQYNALLENLQLWGGDVDAGGYALTNVGDFTATGIVTLPDTVKFGADWQTYTPTITAAGAMTASALQVVSAQYLRRGAECLMQLHFFVTLGGTLDAFVYVSLALAPAGFAGGILAPAALLVPSGQWLLTPAWVDAPNKRLVMGMPGGAGIPFEAGVNECMFNVSYRVS